MKTKNQKKTFTAPKKIERGPFSLVRFCMLRLKSKKKRKGGPFPITLMRFPVFRLVEQTEQKFRRIRDCLKEKQARNGPSRRHI